ncbi:MAG: sodium-dependent bicarbonate transport family permease [Burkholderiaceae bacterium]|nr:sodium-dependent bicarbonate transport family permease [Burkholderiaceae bacterium]
MASAALLGLALEAVVLFFQLGAVAGLAKSDSKLPLALDDARSIYLLLAGGLLIGWARKARAVPPGDAGRRIRMAVICDPATAEAMPARAGVRTRPAGAARRRVPIARARRRR